MGNPFHVAHTFLASTLLAHAPDARPRDRFFRVVFVVVVVGLSTFFPRPFSFEIIRFLFTIIKRNKIQMAEMEKKKHTHTPRSLRVSCLPSLTFHFVSFDVRVVFFSTPTAFHFGHDELQIVCESDVCNSLVLDSGLLVAGPRKRRGENMSGGMCINVNEFLFIGPFIRQQTRAKIGPNKITTKLKASNHSFQLAFLCWPLRALASYRSA